MSWEAAFEEYKRLRCMHTCIPHAHDLHNAEEGAGAEVQRSPVVEALSLMQTSAFVLAPQVFDGEEYHLAPPGFLPQLCGVCLEELHHYEEATTFCAACMHLGREGRCYHQRCLKFHNCQACDRATEQEPTTLDNF